MPQLTQAQCDQCNVHCSQCITACLDFGNEALAANDVAMAVQCYNTIAACAFCLAACANGVNQRIATAAATLSCTKCASICQTDPDGEACAQVCLECAKVCEACAKALKESPDSTED
jgi:hypothetical protein